MPGYGSIPPDERTGGNKTRYPAGYTPQAQSPPPSPGDYQLPDWGYTGPITHPDTRGNPFYDPQATYANPGGPHTDPRNNPLYYNQFGTENPEGYYYSQLAQRGLGGFDARSITAQSMFRDYARGFKAAQMQNAELTFPEYFAMHGINLEHILNSFSDEQLGIDRQRYSGGGGYNWALRG